MSLRTPDDVFVDYCGRRRGILRALTTEVDQFYLQCDPARENLCLYGYSDGSWEVALPCEEVPPELPEPALGINFARDGMQRQDWLSLVAVHSDSWLMSVAFYNGARLDAEGRRQLFNDINSLPTCYEIVSGRVTSKPPGSAAQVGKRPVGSGAPAPMPVAHMKRGRPGPGYRYSRPDDADDNEEEEGAGSDPCPNCGRLYKSGEFWIACDICDRWYDGQCVGMTPQKADRSNKWACPFCAARG